MNPLAWALVYAIAAGQGVLLSVVLWRRRVNPHSNRVLAVWIALVSADLVCRALYIHQPESGVLPLYGLARFLPFVYGSLFYVYVRTLTEERPVRWRDAIHLLGFGLMLLVNLDLFMQSQAETRELLRRLAHGEHSLRFVLMDWALYLYSLSYVAAALLCVRRYRTRLVARSSNVDRITLGWLMAMAVSQIIIWTIAVMVTVGHLPFISHWWIYGAVAGWIFLVGYLSLRQVDVHHQPAIRAPAGASGSDQRLREVADRVRALMQADRLYRKPALSIAELSRQSGYPEYLVSQALNQVIGQTFLADVTELRIVEARERLERPEDPATILDIAYDCGFTSKSTFNTAFKRLVGVTPSAYRAARTVAPA